MTRRRVLGIIAGLGLTLAAAAAAIHWRTPEPEPPAMDLGRVLGRGGDSGFARADHQRRFRFPHDYGPHPRFRSEWWYFTGNLHTPAGRRFGYELTVFRIALAPRAPLRKSDWGTNQVYMAHFAITDAQGRRFHYFQRFARGAIGLAGARAAPFRVWLGDWSVQAARGAAPPWRLNASTTKVQLQLQLTPEKPVVLQGDHGLSQKSAAPGNASYYYSVTRIASRGRLRLDGHDYAVQGLSWLDREWSTSALGPNQVGWDWFALQLDDGRDLMFYRLRDRNGRTDPHSTGVLVDRRGHSKPLRVGDVHLQVLDTWTSPRGGTYPSGWRLQVPAERLSLTIRPLLPDQELDVSVRYWEGAVQVRGKRDGHAIAGAGYVELTGYAGSQRQASTR